MSCKHALPTSGPNSRPSKKVQSHSVVLIATGVRRLLRAVPHWRGGPTRGAGEGSKRKFGSFSAVSAQIFGRQHPFCSILWDLQNHLAENSKFGGNWQNLATSATLAEVLQILMKFNFTNIADFNNIVFAKCLKVWSGAKMRNSCKA